MRPAVLRLSLVLAAVAACGPPPFDDHTVERLEGKARFDALASDDPRHPELKFIVLGFDQPRGQTVRFMDARFYTLHDEWSWFRLLNGQPAPGIPLEPVAGLSFATIQDVYAWAASQPALPLDLTWTPDGRLYSPTFYRVGLYERPPTLGLGTLMYLPAREDLGREENWVFFLEYDDPVSHEGLTLYFEALSRALPAALFDRLFWAIRSPVQEELAQRMEREGLRWSDRLVRMRELAVRGEVEVYAPGLTAGRVRRLAASDPGLHRTQPSDVLVLEAVPDYLPPAAAVLSATPQTPLSHVAVLARNRGIPDAYRGGLFDDLELESLSRIGAPVVVHAASPDQLVLKPISELQFATWQRLGSKPEVAASAVDPSSLPYAQDLAALSLSEVDRLRPSIGGKAAGFLALLQAAPDAAPHRPAVVTVRAYQEHLAPLRSRLEQLLAHPEFVASGRIRYLVLEGPVRYDVRYAAPADQRAKEEFLRAHPAGDLLGDVVAAGGVKELFCSQPVAPATLEAIRGFLAAQFAAYPASQALRFRSSSTLEDIEGFNGAGLYDSNTGFLDAAAQPRAEDRARTVESALQRTWSSYWGAEAFEERRLENVDHLSGAMAVLVHARFDDALELANGVVLFTLLPPGGAERARMEVNVQLGTTSVTNPPPGSTAFPEVDRVVQRADGTLQVERVKPSTLAAPGDVVLSEAALGEMFARAERVAKAWLSQANQNLPPAQAARALVLDLELREVAAGWPAGLSLPRRVVLKQARSLEPGARAVPDSVRALPLPRDVLTRARRVERRSCEGADLTVRVTEAYTDPLLPPDLGHDREPFTAQVELQLARPLLGLPAGTRLALDHLMLAAVRHPTLAQGRWSMVATLTPDAAVRERLDGLEVTAQGTYRLSRGAEVAEGGGLSCRRELPFSTPRDYLLGLLEE